jgi:hypothetical protein
MESRAGLKNLEITLFLQLKSDYPHGKGRYHHQTRHPKAIVGAAKGIPDSARGAGLPSQTGL